MFIISIFEKSNFLHMRHLSNSLSTCMNLLGVKVIDFGLVWELIDQATQAYKAQIHI